MEKKILVVGTSFGSTYLNAAAESEHWKIGGIVARTEKSVKKTGKKFGIEKDRQFTDLDTALNNLDDITAVAITTPNNLHYNMAKSVLEHGKHLILEKPIVEEWEEAVDLVRLLDQNSNLKAMVGQTLRGDMMIRLMEYFINKEKLIGEVEQMTFESHWNWIDDPEKSWRFKLENMYLDDIGIHQFDEIRMILNNRKCESIMAKSFNPKSYPLPILTTTSAILSFEDNILVNYFGSMSCKGSDIGWYGRSEVFGTSGAMIREPSGQPTFFPHDKKSRKRPIGLDDKYGDELDKYLYLPELEKIPYLLEDFHFAIEENRAPITDLHDNIHTFAILLGVKKSAKERREIIIKEEFPL